MLRRDFPGSAKIGANTLKTANFVELAPSTALRNPYPQEALYTVATEKTDSPSEWKKAVPWLAILGVVITLFTFFYTSVLPDKIEAVLSHSKSIDDIRTDVKSVKAGIDDLRGGVSEILPLLAPLKDPRLIVETLKNTASMDPALLMKELPSARKLLPILRASKDRVPTKAYREISAPLSKVYDSTQQQDLKNEVWLTLTDLAGTKSTTDVRMYAIPDAEIKLAKESGNFIEGGVTDLSEKERWTNTIFKNCIITITKPAQPLSLVHVRFRDVDFETIPQNKTSENLVLGVLKSDGPIITTKPSVGIIYKPGSIVPKDKAMAKSSIFLVARRH